MFFQIGEELPYAGTSVPTPGTTYYLYVSSQSGNTSSSGKSSSSGSVGIKAPRNTGTGNWNQPTTGAWTKTKDGKWNFGNTEIKTFKKVWGYIYNKKAKKNETKSYKEGTQSAYIQKFKPKKMENQLTSSEIKLQKELKHCSFKPKLNGKSMQMTKNRKPKDPVLQFEKQQLKREKVNIQHIKEITKLCPFKPKVNKEIKLQINKSQIMNFMERMKHYQTLKQQNISSLMENIKAQQTPFCPQTLKQTKKMNETLDKKFKMNISKKQKLIQLIQPKVKA